MNVEAQIVEGIKYKPYLLPKLSEFAIAEFDINTSGSASILILNQNRFAISKWVSPKRTRSYPYARVYNTLAFSKRITVIPIVKDEGLKGDRDFLQWDTMSLMSLLDVYVILAYYKRAEKHPAKLNKITKQLFDRDYVLEKIREIDEYYSSALHWNLKELRLLPRVLGKTRQSQQQISAETGVKFHNQRGLSMFIERICSDLESFMESSRLKSELAQSREFVTNQPKEKLSTDTKAKITITNYLGGKYFFTADGITFEEDTISLIEAKHTKRSKIPNVSDIKDGLVKMILYSNLEKVSVDGNLRKAFPTLILTSHKLRGVLSPHLRKLK